MYDWKAFPIAQNIDISMQIFSIVKDTDVPLK
jgi:hypothetical protein